MPHPSAGQRNQGWRAEVAEQVAVETRLRRGTAAGTRDRIGVFVVVVPVAPPVVVEAMRPRRPVVAQLMETGVPAHAVLEVTEGDHGDENSDRATSSSSPSEATAVPSVCRWVRGEEAGSAGHPAHGRDCGTGVRAQSNGCGRAA